MAVISGMFHQEKELERAADLLEQAGFSKLFISSQSDPELPVPGSFFVSDIQREQYTENNFGISPGVPLPVFSAAPSKGLRLTVQVKKADQPQAITLLRRSHAKQIQVQS